MKTYAKITLAAVFSLAFIISSNSASAGTEIFTRYLQKGDTGQDVLLLQQVLNSDPQTIVTDSGNGSSGFETDFFGELTKQAVIKYQKKNTLGTKYGFFTIYSGALDDKTRASLNAKFATSGENSALPSTETPEQQKLNATYRLSNPSTLTPFIQSITPGSVKNGDTVTISGRNFSTSTPNTVRMTYNSVAATSTDGTTLQVKVQSSIQDMFNEEAKDLTSSEQNNVKDKIGNIPLFITVQNIKGVSNPYQIYVGVK